MAAAPTPSPRSNRTDLRTAIPKQAVPGQPYGEAGAQLSAQEAVPMGRPDLPPLDPFDRPTERPDEPITAGAPFGPGAGPETLSFPMAPPPAGSPQALYERLQALWQAVPDARNANLAALIQAVGERTPGGRLPSALRQVSRATVRAATGVGTGDDIGQGA